MIAFPPDITFVIQIVSFFILWMGLKRLVFDPTLAVLEERRQRTAGVRAQAAELRSEADRLAATVEQKLAEVRAEVRRRGEAARSAAEEEERRVLEAAHEQAAAHVRQQRALVRAQAEAARKALSEERAALARLIVAKVVGVEQG